MRYPDVGLELHENSSPQQLEGLRNASLDLAFLWTTRLETTETITLHPISRDGLQIAMREDHPLANKRALTIEDLAAFPIFLALRQIQTAFFDALVTKFEKAGLEPDLRTDINQLPFVLNILATGYGITFLPEFLRQLKIEDIVFRPCPFLPKDVCQMTLALAALKGTTSPLVKNFIETASSVRP